MKKPPDESGGFLFFLLFVKRLAVSLVPLAFFTRFI